MSLALYRTYRPGKFADVIGQDHVTGPLMRALANDRTHHAYLFSGPRGCGKTSSARILARSLNCAAGPTAEPCEICDSCVALAPNGPGSLDVVELDAASNRGIDQARELRERAMYAPASSKYRIYIIDEAHQLTTEAVNALLKLVEEPPAHLKFVFATTEPEKLLGTIRSRTHHYPFRLVPTTVLQEHLARVCAAEGLTADPAALALAAKAGAGSVRDSLSVLGQLVGGAGSEGITYEAAVAQLGFTSDSLLDQILDALPNREGAAVFKTIEQVVTAGHDPRRFATDLLERIRDLIILLANPAAANDGLVHQPADRLAILQTQADAIGMAGLSRAADLVSDGITALRGASSPRLHLELLAARLIVAASDANPAELLQRVEAVERKIAQGIPAAAAPTAPARPAAPPKLSEIAVAPIVTPAPVTPVVEAPVVEAPVVEAPTTAPTPTPAVETPAVVTQAAETPASVAAPSAESAVPADSANVDIATLSTNWKTIAKLVESLPDGTKFASSLLENFGVTAVNGNQVEITTPNQALAKMLKDRGVDKLAEAAIAQFAKVNVKVVGLVDPNFKVNQAAASTAENMSPKPLAASMPVATTETVAAPEPAAAPAEPVVEAAPAVPAVSIETEPTAEPTPVSAAVEAEESDEPSADDPFVIDATGIDAILDAFGGTVIEEEK